MRTDAQTRRTHSGPAVTHTQVRTMCAYMNTNIHAHRHQTLRGVSGRRRRSDEANVFRQARWLAHSNWEREKSVSHTFRTNHERTRVGIIYAACSASSQNIHTTCTFYTRAYDRHTQLVELSSTAAATTIAVATATKPAAAAAA